MIVDWLTTMFNVQATLNKVLVKRESDWLMAPSEILIHFAWKATVMEDQVFPRQKDFYISCSSMSKKKMIRVSCNQKQLKLLDERRY